MLLGFTDRGEPFCSQETCCQGAAVPPQGAEGVQAMAERAQGQTLVSREAWEKQ